jgi:glyoxylase-like metal-dependent hydrolase (beta-lactamase superfamily II)
MKLEQTELKSNSAIGSGSVRRFAFPDSKLRVTQITTFCPDVIGPGPTHLYLIESDALVLVDMGIPTDLAKAFFYDLRNQQMPPELEALPPDLSEQELLAGFKLAGYSLKDVDLVVLSHGHPDHFLMGHSILKRATPAISAHILDTPQICNPWGLLSFWFSRQEQMIATGMPAPWSARGAGREQVIHGLDLDAMGMALKVDSPIFRNGPLNLNGSPVRDVEVRHLPGHSPGSIGLLIGQNGDSKALLCGDVLLNPITPHPDDLLVYLQTLEDLSRMEDVGLVLPAHGEPIQDLKARVDFLRRHHYHRLKETYEACSEPRSVWEIATMNGYFDTYVDPDKFNFMAGTEALVHVEVLNMVGGLSRSYIRDQVHYFQNSGESFDEVYNRITELVTDKKISTIMRY